jgi:hypothetical protein
MSRPKKGLESIAEKKAKDREVRETEQALSGRLYRATRGSLIVPRSKVSNGGSRADLLRDRAIMQALYKKTEKGGVFSLTAKRPRPVKEKGESPKAKLKRLSKRKIWGFAKRLDREAKPYITKTTDLAGGRVWKVYLPNWSHVTDIIKCAAYGEAMYDWLRYSYSLHLAEGVIQAALRSKKGFVPYLHDQIDQELKRVFRNHYGEGPAPQHITTLEGAYYQNACVTEPFHLHGAFEIPDTYEDYGRDPHDLVRLALLTVGGEWHDRARQLKTRRMYGPTGWFTYSAKWRLATINALAAARKEFGIPARKGRESLIGATTSIRRRGKAWFNRARKTEELIVVPPKRRRNATGSKSKRPSRKPLPYPYGPRKRRPA